jgi:hypothetical protein
MLSWEDDIEMILKELGRPSLIKIFVNMILNLKDMRGAGQF